jgi:hypothetical protein
MGTFEERACLAREAWQLAADKGRDAAVGNRRRRLEAKFEAAIDLLLEAAGGQLAFRLLCQAPSAFGLFACQA